MLAIDPCLQFSRDIASFEHACPNQLTAGLWRMNSAFDAARMTHELLSVRGERRQLEVASLSGQPQSIADAYAVQARVMDEIGPAGAFKTNRLDDGTQIVAPIAASTVVPSGTSFADNRFMLCGVELELAFRLEHPLPAADDPDWAHKISNAFVALPVLEIVDSRLLDHTRSPSLVQLADNLSNGALVYGEPLTNWSECNLSAPQHELSAGQRALSKGAGAVPGGSALSLLHGFLRCIGDHCGGVQPGQIVTTGALSGVHWLGDESGSEPVRGSIESLGSVSCIVARAL